MVLIMEEDPPDTSRCVRISRLIKLFNRDQIHEIDQTALDMSHLSEKAMFLFKLVTLENFVPVSDFTHQWALDFSETIDLSEKNFKRLFAVANSGGHQRGRPPNEESQVVLGRLSNSFRRHSDLGEALDISNVSFAIAYEAEKWSTVYTNNIFLHFVRCKVP